MSEAKIRVFRFEKLVQTILVDVNKPAIFTISELELMARITFGHETNHRGDAYSSQLRIQVAPGSSLLYEYCEGFVFDICHQRY